MTDRELEQVKKLWAQGFSANKISRLLPYKEYITKREITRLKKEGVLPSRKVADIRDKTIIEEFQKNKNLKEIGDKFGIGAPYVAKILERNGIGHPKVMNFTQKPPSDKKQAILDDLAKGLTLSEIAVKHGCSRQYIFQIKEGVR